MGRYTKETFLYITFFKNLYYSQPKYVILSIVRLGQRRDGLMVVLSGNRKEVHMDTLEILTLLLVIFAALSYLDNHHKK